MLWANDLKSSARTPVAAGDARAVCSVLVQYAQRVKGTRWMDVVLSYPAKVDSL